MCEITSQVDLRIPGPKIDGVLRFRNRCIYICLLQAGLALFAASGELDLRQLTPPGEAEAKSESGGNVLQRLIAAFKSNY